MNPQPTTDDRPDPILDAIKAKAWVPAVGALVSVAAMIGLLTAEQANAINGAVATLLGLVSTVVPIIAGLVHVFQTRAQAKPQVTPVSSPAALDHTTGKLVPLVPLSGGPGAKGATVDQL